MSELSGWTAKLEPSLSRFLSDQGPAPNLRDPRAVELDAALEGSDQVPAPLSEGIIWDVLEVFKGSGSWTAAHVRAGLRAHPGFDVQDGPAGDLAGPTLVGLLVSLVLRRVVLIWHFGIPCAPWGTLRRPRQRSQFHPVGLSLIHI